MISVRHGENVHIVPCGKCAYCLQNKRSSWIMRIGQEMKKQEYPGWFITLTYDEKHVRRVGPLGRLSLRFRDVQLFFKRLRKLKYYVKYVAVGEYGGETGRPHYHVLLWTQATPKVIQEQWKSSKDNSVLGRVHFGRLNLRSAMYTMKYIIQPKPPEYEGVERPRAQFSKGLGLGFLTTSMYNYLTDDYDNPVTTVKIDGNLVSLPRYYRNKIFTKYQMRKLQHKVKWDMIRKKRKYMRELLAQGVTNTKEYIKALRVERARRIIDKTKYNQKL